MIHSLFHRYPNHIFTEVKVKSLSLNDLIDSVSTTPIFFLNRMMTIKTRRPGRQLVFFLSQCWFPSLADRGDRSSGLSTHLFIALTRSYTATESRISSENLKALESSPDYSSSACTSSAWHICAAFAATPSASSPSTSNDGLQSHIPSNKYCITFFLIWTSLRSARIFHFLEHVSLIPCRRRSDITCTIYKKDLETARIHVNTLVSCSFLSNRWFGFFIFARVFISLQKWW